MVIEAITPKSHSKKPPQGNTSLPYRLASPTDRLAAAVLDWLVIVTPILVVLISPLKRAMTESVLLDTQTQFSMAVTMSVVVALVLIWLYQTVSVYLYGATPGKMAFGLRVVDFWDQSRPTLGACALRAVVVVFEVALAGLPWLAAFSDSRRRVMHDKIADTIVVANQRPSVLAPGIGQVAFVRGVYAAAVALVLMIIAAATMEVFRGLESQEKFFGWTRSQEEAPDHCREVDHALSEEDSMDGSLRLETAMELFAAGLVDQECLQTEADRNLNHGPEDTSLGYLAMAFAVAEDPERSNEYLRQTCLSEPESEACHMTDIVLNWSSEDWNKVGRLFQKFDEKSSSHVLVWKLRYLMREGSYLSALNVLGHLQGRGHLAEFLVPERVKALWRSNRTGEADLVASTAFETMNTSGRKNLASWMCYEELSYRCSMEPPLSCQELVKSAKADEDSSLPPTGWLAMVLLKEKCNGPARPRDYQELARVSESSGVGDLLEGLEMWARGDKKLARAHLTEVAKNEDGLDIVRAEALKRLVLWSTKDDEVAGWVRKWRAFNRASRHSLGPALYRALVERGELKQALSVGLQVIKESPEELELGKEVAMTAYHVGDYSSAWKLVSNLTQSQDTGGGRAPASQDDFRSVARALKKRYGGK